MDADRAAARHKKAKAGRRVDVFADDDGMGTLWARMTAPDAAASFEWLTRLARGMDADAVWKRLVFDPLSGVQLDYGRTTYRPPAGLADFVRGRDVTCRNPRCPRAAAGAPS